MAANTRWTLTIVSAVVVGLVLVIVYAGLLGLEGRVDSVRLWGNRFDSNGERIYFTASSDSGQPIVAEMGHMTASTPMMACADCHGADGRGGTVWMMMGWVDAPDIRYQTLTAAEHEEGHAPYTEELIKRAITQGLDPAGEPLEFPMPRWRMSAADLEDLIGYLKQLQ